MRKVRIALLCLLVSGLAACGTDSPTGPDSPDFLFTPVLPVLPERPALPDVPAGPVDPDNPEILESCGYLGSGACPDFPVEQVAGS